MGNLVRVLIWVGFCTAACLLFAVDACQISDIVTQKKEVIKLANVAQEASLLQAKHVTRMEETLTGYNQELLQKQQQIQLLEKSLETATLQLQGLVDDNSKLEAELDSASVKLKAIEDKLLKTQEDLAAKVKELEEAQNHG